MIPMPRKPRLTQLGMTHHVFSRCIEKKGLLNDTFASELLIEVLHMAQDKYAFELIAFQIMDNHFHFVIQTVEDGKTISRIMQYIKARFAERYNRANERCGPFWNERFKDIVIEQSDNPMHYLLWLLWYLAFNPVRKKLTTNPRKYRYSSINCYLDEQHICPLKITLHQYFLWLGDTFADRMKSFLYYEEAYRKRLAIMF